MLADQAGRLSPVEVKSGSTVATDFAAALLRWRELAASEAGPGTVVYGGDETYVRGGIRYVGWRDVPGMIDWLPGV